MWPFVFLSINRLAQVPAMCWSIPMFLCPVSQPMSRIFADFLSWPHSEYLCIVGWIEGCAMYGNSTQSPWIPAYSTTFLEGVVSFRVTIFALVWLVIPANDSNFHAPKVPSSPTSLWLDSYLLRSRCFDTSPRRSFECWPQSKWGWGLAKKGRMWQVKRRLEGSRLVTCY